VGSEQVMRRSRQQIPRGGKMNILNENIWVSLLNKLQITEPNEGKFCPYFLLGGRPL